MSRWDQCFIQPAVTTLFVLMEQNYNFWKDVKGSKPVPIPGEVLSEKPEVFDISQENLVEYFKTGYNHFGALWENILETENYERIGEIAAYSIDDSSFPKDLWCRTLYDIAVTFRNWRRNITNEEAEQVVENQAERFESTKDYLLRKGEEEEKGEINWILHV